MLLQDLCSAVVAERFGVKMKKIVVLGVLILLSLTACAESGGFSLPADSLAGAVCALNNNNPIQPRMIMVTMDTDGFTIFYRV